MLLSDLVEVVKSCSDSDDPEIRIVTYRCPMMAIPEIGVNMDVIPRSGYYDETFWDKDIPKGDFVVLDFL